MTRSHKSCGFEMFSFFSVRFGMDVVAVHFFRKGRFSGV